LIGLQRYEESLDVPSQDLARILKRDGTSFTKLVVDRRANEGEFFDGNQRGEAPQRLRKVSRRESPMVSNRRR
jgi:hypothetical protein